ncbi:MAG: polyprenyl synthetase family protein [Candidatus Asgardarchaeia archaeon]
MIDFNQYFQEKKDLIEKYLDKIMPKDQETENFYDAMRYAIFIGGKRIRPILSLVATELAGGNIDAALPFAAAIEMIHNFTLIHDDIEDGDTTRRNKPAVWVKYGLDNGINIGDGLFTLAYQHILNSDIYDAEQKLKLLKILTDTTLEICEGQALDMSFRRKDVVTEEDYMRMIFKKTGVLLSAALKGGAIIARTSDPNLIEALEDYGKHIGPAFQIRDDILDLTEGKGREAIGNDIREGKRSLLVIHLLQKCAPEERKKVLEILNKPRDKTTESDVRYIIELMNKYGSIEYAMQKSIELKNKAVNALKNIDDNNIYKKLLIKLAEFIVYRKK